MGDNNLKEQLKTMAQAVAQMENAANVFKQTLGALLGASEAEEIYGAVLQQPTSPLQSEIANVGFGNQKSVEETMAEIRQMLAALNMKGSVREHRTGLLKCTISKINCVVYGRSKEEIEKKVYAHIKKYRANKGKKTKAKKVIPLLSVFYRENYLPYKRARGIAEGTVESYEQYLRFVVKQKFDKRLTEYTSIKIEKFLYSFPHTRKRQIMQSFLNNLFDRAVAVELIKTNPCKSIEKPVHKQKQGTAFSFDEQAEFMRLLINNQRLTYREKCYFVFVFLVGARRNEPLTFTTECVDFKNKILSIHGTKTEGSNRQIPLTPLVERLLLSMNIKKGKYFTVTETQTDKLFREIWEKKKGHKLHDLRHTFGTVQICVEKVDVKTVSLWLGHSTIDTTLQIYTHPEQLDKGTFLRGDLTEAEKLAVYREKYNRVLQLITEFIAKRSA